MSIFQKSIINKYLKNLDNDKVNLAFQQFQRFYGEKLRLSDIIQMKEENYQEGFLREVFVQSLGYTIRPDLNYNLTTEYKNQTDSKKADGAIIRNNSALGVIELKSTKTFNLDNIKNQAFNYKNNQPDCRYVITSNFHYLRFYIDNSTEYEEFDLFEFTEQDFKLFYLILSQESIFNDIPLKMKEETKFHEVSISDKFYMDYKAFKDRIFENLVKNNQQFDKLTLFKKSQKLLDRFLFVYFAEDCGLCPPNSIQKIIDQWKTLKANDAYAPLYSRFQKLFNYLDVGKKFETFEFPAYNGGLFKPDELLDNEKTVVEDFILLKHCPKLSAYDFNTDIDVNILGHIFEHSLNEIEEISAELQGETIEKSKTKRKKDGIFYTPKYITHYIVENTIGKLCKDKQIELQIADIEINETFNKKGKITKQGKELFIKFQEYKNWLLSLKILDPACGSGAFLNSALDFLIKEHQQIDDLISDLTGDKIRMFDTDKNILENNIFGVDINEESVEIAKLSLWLRTAKKGRTLSDLNNNIKCGNSLIDNKEIAGEKAFKWETEFSEIMQNGGFDVVIGNPPWVSLIGKHGHNTINEETQKWLINHYCSNTYLPNLFEIFIIRSLSLIKKNGYFSFIVPDRLGYNASFNYLREKVLNDYKLVEIIYKWDFPLIITDTMTFVIQNKRINDYSITIKSEPKNGTIIFTKQQLLLNQDIQFKSFKNQIAKSLIDKIISKSVNLSELCSITSGFGGKSDLITSEQINSNQIPVYKGSSIGRFEIKENLWFEFIPANITGRTTDKAKLSASPKILIRKTGNSIIATYDESGIFPEQSLYFIYNLKTDFDYKYLLALLNSNLMTWFFINYLVTNLDSTPQIKLVDLEQIPILETSKENQKLLIECADLILNFKLSLKKSEKFINRINSHLEIKTITHKLSEFYNYDFKTFIGELEKQKIKLTFKQSDEWEEYFNDYKKELKEIQLHINQSNRKLNELISRFYELTNEEIEIIENATKG